MRKKINVRPGQAAAAVIAGALAIAVLISPQSAAAFGGRLAVMSALWSMPFQAIGGVLYQPSEPEATSASQTRESKLSPENTVKKPGGKQTDAATITDTPADIAKLITQYEAKAKDDKKDGAISQKDYNTSGRTDEYGSVFVKNVNDTDIDIEALLKSKADLSVDREQPCILIIHTHTTEAYQILDRDFYAAGYTTRSNSSSTNIARVGTAVAEQIEAAGFKVVHDKTIYDTSYSGAYDRSCAATLKWLEKYPTIQIVLDIHRDAIQLSGGTKVKPTAVIDGKKAAQIMIISGCQEQGNGVSGFPEWKKNLTFAVQLQKKLEDAAEGVTRPLYFCPRKYNMNLTPCSLLIEMGSDANTLCEAVYSGAILGRAVASLMGEYT